MGTPAMLVRTTLWWLIGQLLATVVVAAAVPDGASTLVLLGFVTPAYDHNVFSVRVTEVPWTDPTVWFSIQTVIQTLTVALAAASLITLVRTNPWQHGVLTDSAAPKRRESTPADTSTSAATGPGCTPAGASSAPPGPPSPSGQPASGDATSTTPATPSTPGSPLPQRPQRPLPGPREQRQ